MTFHRMLRHDEAAARGAGGGGGGATAAACCAAAPSFALAPLSQSRARARRVVVTWDIFSTISIVARSPVLVHSKDSLRTAHVDR